MDRDTQCTNEQESQTNSDRPPEVLFTEGIGTIKVSDKLITSNLQRSLEWPSIRPR